MYLIHNWVFLATRLSTLAEGSRRSLTSASRSAQIGGSYLGGFRRWRWYVLRHVAHELVFVLDLEGLVEPALEANRGHRLTAQGSPTNRARIGSRQNFQIVRVCPLSKNQGSGPRVLSVTKREMCSGVWPGVCNTRTCTLPRSRLSPSLTGKNSYPAPQLA